MTIELWTLVGSIGILFTLIMIQAFHLDKLMGRKWAVSNRETPKTPTPFGNRVDRAVDNLKENMMLFAPIALILAIVEISTGLTQIGALTFFASRLVHAISFLRGVTRVRTLAWIAGLVGINMMIFGLIANS